MAEDKRARTPPTQPDFSQGNLCAVALDVELDPPSKDEFPVSWVQVLPFGEVRIQDSRGDFDVTTRSVLNILSEFAESRTDLAVDYNHAMYWGEEDAVAAGWGEKIRAVVPADVAARLIAYFAGGDVGTTGVTEYSRDDRLEIKVAGEDDTEGIFVYVRWTQEAAEKIRAREFRYISPVIFFSFTGEPNFLWNIAVVNTPAIDGMLPLAAKQETGGVIDGVKPSRVFRDEAASMTTPPNVHYCHVVDDLASDPTWQSIDVSANANDEWVWIDPGSGGCYRISTGGTTYETTTGTRDLLEYTLVNPDEANQSGDSPEKGGQRMAFFEDMIRVLGLSTEDADQAPAEGDVLVAAERMQTALAAAQEEIATLTTERDGLVEQMAEKNQMIDEQNERLEKAASEERERDIADAIAAGLLTPAQKEWAVENYDAAMAFVETLEGKPQVPLGRQTIDDDGKDTIGDNRQVERDQIREYRAKHPGTSVGEARAALAAGKE